MEEERQNPIAELQEKLLRGEISRRDFLRYATVLGISLGAAQALVACAPKATPTTAPAAMATTAPAATATTAPAAPPAAAPPAPAKEAKAGHMLRFNPAVCTGCLICAVACAEKWATEYFPEETKDVVNLEFSRIRPMRSQYVDVVNVCTYCKLIAWAEGSDKAPCQQVCPEDAIIVVPEGEGKEGFTGMGYMTIDRDKCTGLDLCGRCLEVCEDQFASGISFDPIEGKAQICTMCGGLPACVEACPEPTALQFVPLMTNGRYFANPPEAYMELVYAKIFGKRRDL
ncbi:MAG: twin-arginine translocation signal domain-containing protein [Anaerolineales bacterium]|nr:twin-arginine translocation signal domain-containing protein [Anaerolineales bacterium]